MKWDIIFRLAVIQIIIYFGCLTGDAQNPRERLRLKTPRQIPDGDDL